MKKFNFSKGLVIGLLTLALCLTCFAAAKVSAEDAAATPTKSAAVAATYDAAEDAVTSTANATAYVYVLKAASGNKLKAGTAANGQMAAGKITISDLGIKGTAKDVYLYVCDKEVEVEETVAANLTIKGNANKVVGVIDYTQADVEESLKVLSAYYVDKSTKKSVDIAAEKTLWSSDGEKFYAVNSQGETAQRKDSQGNTLCDGFMGLDLAGMLEGGGTIYLKQAGTDGATGTAQFGSKVVKVKIAKQAKAVKAKIDVSKDTIALKNGFDFAVATKAENGTEYDQYGTWWTILPVLKTATVSSEGESIIGGVLGTGNDAKVTVYKPLDKKNTNAGKAVEVSGTNAQGQAYTEYQYSYTKYAFKALSIDKLFDKLESMNADKTKLAAGDFRIAIRKSATEKKPASAVSVIELAYQTEKPLVITQDNVDKQFLVASADEFTKKGITLNEVVGFPGYTVANSQKAIATEGFDSTFKVSDASENIKERDEGTSFEYAVVATADYKVKSGDDAIDWTTVKWKKFDPSKLKITEKLSGKYNTVKGTKKTATLKATASGDISVGDSKTETDAYKRTVVKEAVIEENTKALLLIRRAGDKASGTRASKPIALYVAKEGKKYNLYSTVSNGEVADKYTVAFFKYDATKKAFIRDEKIATISGWSQKAKTGVKLEALTDAEYWKIASVTEGVATLGDAKYTAATEKLTGDGTDDVQVGEYQIENGGDDDGSVESATINVAIREFANIKVIVKTQIGTDAPVEVTTKNVTVTKGKIGSATTVTCYVGLACEIPVTAPDKPSKTGYTVADNPTVVIAPTTGVTYDNGKVTVTPTSAEEVEITLTFKYTATPEPTQAPANP